MFTKLKLWHQGRMIRNGKCPICGSRLDISECENYLCRPCDVIIKK